METTQLNRVELRGVVGSVKTSEVSAQSLGKTLTRFSLATNLAYKDINGCAVIETTWHNIEYWGDAEVKKGDKVEVIGRLKSVKYTGANGDEHTTVVIVAKSVTVIEQEKFMEMEVK